jgi:hypothetical protein
MMTFNELYLDEVYQTVAHALETLEYSTEDQNAVTVARAAKNLLERDHSSPQKRAESIFASRLLLTAVMEKMREESHGKKQVELDRRAYDLKEVSMAGAHGGPIVGLIALLTRKIAERTTGEKAFKERIGRVTLTFLETISIPEEYKNDLKRIIKERVPRTF